MNRFAVFVRSSPMPPVDAGGKKTAAAVHQEVSREIQTLLQVVFAGQRKEQGLDLEAVEMATRASVHRAGSAVLSGLLSARGDYPTRVSCSCGSEAHYHDQRSKQLLSVVGPVDYRRSYYVCPLCQQGQCPRDRELDVESTEYSPGMRRMMAMVGSESSFHRGREQLELLAGLQVTTKAVERQAEAIGADIARREQIRIDQAIQLELPEILGPRVPKFYIEMDGVQVPILKADTEGRAGRTPGQRARTREVKLGCVFTQTTCDEEGRPIREEASTTYVGAIEEAEEFGRRLYLEVWQRGWSRACLKVVLGDGAPWIWNLADQFFPGAIQIVDLYHAREHIWELAAKLLPLEEERKRWARKMIRLLDAGRIEALVAVFDAFPTSNTDLRDALRAEADYFQRHKERMRYPKFRKLGLFVGSGVIEAGCKTVIGARLKQSGMFWSVRGANAIIALRCNRLSGKFEDYWENRAAA
jgi:hypothetical protein